MQSDEINQEEKRTNSITENELMAMEWIRPVKLTYLLYLLNLFIYLATYITNAIWGEIGLLIIKTKLKYTKTNIPNQLKQSGL